MMKPVLLIVDDETNILDAVIEDLRCEYGAAYRIQHSSGAEAGLEALAQLKSRQEPVALLMSYQYLSGMNGVEFLQRSRAIFPEAKRALLTAFADHATTIHATNTGFIHFCQSRPWSPPQEKLFPTLTDLLEDWCANYHPPFEGLRVVGRRWSLRDHKIRNFLSRNHVPYCWLEIEGNDAALQLLADRKLDPGRLPVVLFADGSSLVDPEPAELASRVGLSTQAEQEFYDMVVVGGGPAGLAAAVYGASEGLHTLVIEPVAPGGQAGSTSKIENYLGFPSGITGADLGRRARAQATRLGAEFLTQQATALRIDGQYRFVQLGDGREVSSHAVLLASGVHYRKLDIPGAALLTGRGIYYGAALVEAVSCQNEEVYIVGGANSAGQAAVHFANFACKVVMLVRGPSLAATMSKYLIDEIERTPNIEVMPQTQVVEAYGKERLESLRLSDPQGERRVPASSLFVFIGAEPSTEWLPPEILRDEQGFLLAGPDLRSEDRLNGAWAEPRAPYLLESSVPGVFVAGDVRHGSIKRVASAVGEGSIAVNFVHQYLACLCESPKTN
jgi:thioredoxin reductase (NADPH)